MLTLGLTFFRRRSELDALQADTEKARVRLSSTVSKLQRQITKQTQKIEERQGHIARDNARFAFVKMQLTAETRKLLQAEEKVAELERKACLAEMERTSRGASVRLFDLSCRAVSYDRRRTRRRPRWQLAAPRLPRAGLPLQ